MAYKYKTRSYILLTGSKTQFKILSKVSLLRIISGTARGVSLKTSKVSFLRPTTDRVRSAIFSILESKQVLVGAQVLDLYAGTGSLGIESLSRGATISYFVEKDRKLSELVKENASKAGFEDNAKVINTPVNSALDSINGPFDLIFMDPPYQIADQIEGNVSKIVAGNLLSNKGSIVIEHSKKSDLNITENTLEQTMERQYGDTTISIYISKK